MKELERLINFISVQDDHWMWTGGNDGRYGMFWLDGKTVGAHRASWMLLRGPIPQPLEIDHLCEVKLCVRPDHLELVEKVENLTRRRLRNLNNTECKRGHKFSDENVYWYAGRRFCRECRREAGRRYDAVRRAS